MTGRDAGPCIVTAIAQRTFPVRAWLGHPSGRYSGPVVAADKRPRKRPTQSRARVTFDSIVEATDQLLDEYEIEGLTVQMIADRAGVSVGSLYQYFPTKDAIVATVIERDVERVYETLELVFHASVELPIEQLMTTMIRGLLSTYASRLSYYRAILPEIGRLERDGVIRNVADRAQTLVVEAMERSPDAIAIPASRQAAAGFIVARVSNLLAHAVVVERPELLEDPAFAEELIHLSTAYVLGSPRS